MTVVLAAAGSGERAGPGDLKQLRAVGGVPMLLRAIRPFAQHPQVGRIVVVLPADLVERPPTWLADLVGERLVLAGGGETRAASVRNGLALAGSACRRVLVHDAARPFVTRATIDAVLARIAEGVAAVPAVPLADTVKRADDTLRVTETVDRSGLWRAQTPQGFPRDMLEEAFRRVEGDARPRFTDEAALVEAAGFPVVIVPDDPGNIKITTGADFRLAEALLAEP